MGFTANGDRFGGVATRRARPDADESTNMPDL